MTSTTTRQPRFRLVRGHLRPHRWVPSSEQQAVIEHDAGRLRVWAGPGTGKTATIVEAVADRVMRRGEDPASILVLTFSRRAATELSQRISARLRITVSQPLVRTLHSYAYALVREAAMANEEPPPRLLEAGQADLMVRSMLAGQLERDDGAAWPEELRPALSVSAFASELREFLLRAAECEITPGDMARLGRQHGRPEWVAAASFATEARAVSDLRVRTENLGASYDQADLMVAALEQLADPEILGMQQRRIRRIFVDEYQDVDPAQARLIGLLASGAQELVVVGDPDQAIYAFRGATAGALERFDADRSVSLTVCHRMPPVLLAATRRLAGSIPGQAAHRELIPADGDADGRLVVRVLPSQASQAALIADTVRRAASERGVPYSQMAVLLRSPRNGAEPIRRALAGAGIPVAAGAVGALATDPLVGALLTVLRVGQRSGLLTGSAALGLLSSPLGSVDPLSLRRLRRAAKAADRAGGTARAQASADLLAEMLSGDRPVPADLPADLAEPVRRLRAVIAIARRGAKGVAAETVLWQIWEATGLAERLRRASERGGREADRADALLDAVIMLFDRAGQLADQLPGAGVSALLEVVDDEQIPGPTPRRDAEAVSVLSAHAAKGLEWDLVVVAGVQHDTWPDLRPRASLLGLPELLDVAAGHRAGLPAAPQLAEEQRLFYVAATRARHTLVVTAVDDDATAPSRFIADIAGPRGPAIGWPVDRGGRPRRTLGMPALVAELREAAAGSDQARARRAERVLADLARSGIAAADPANWYGVPQPSTEAARIADRARVHLSPSQVDSLLRCPLRAVLEGHGGRAAPTRASRLGTVVHALADGMAHGASEAELDVLVEEFVAAQAELPPWQVAAVRRGIATMRTALRAWMTAHVDDRELVGSELTIDVELPAADRPTGSRPVSLRGRVDRLSRDASGGLVVTDFKTGTQVSKADAEAHPQLAAYQVAGALGAFQDAGAVAGAELVFLRTGSAVERRQSALDEEDTVRWIAVLRQAAEDSAGATLRAQIGDHCRHCPVRTSCPLQPEGRQVTQWH